MRRPEMWLNPGDHSSAITAEFCNFFVVVDVTLHFSLRRSWVSFPPQHLQAFSATSTTSVKKLTQLYVCQLYSNFLSKVFFRVGGLIEDLRSRFLIFMSPVRDCFLLLVGLISLGESTIFQELKLSSLFFSVMLTQKTWLHPGYAQNKGTVVYMHQSCGNSPGKVMLSLPNVSWVWGIYQLFMYSSKVA